MSLIKHTSHLIATRQTLSVTMSSVSAVQNTKTFHPRFAFSVNTK